MNSSNSTLSLGSSSIYNSKLGTTSSVSINSLIQPPHTPISSCNSSTNTGHLLDITTACKLNASGGYQATGGQLPFPEAGTGAVTLGSLCGLPDESAAAHPDYRQNDPAAAAIKPAMPSRCSKTGALFDGAAPPAFGNPYVQPQNYENYRLNPFEAPIPPRK